MGRRGPTKKSQKAATARPPTSFWRENKVLSLRSRIGELREAERGEAVCWTLGASMWCKRKFVCAGYQEARILTGCPTHRETHIITPSKQSTTHRLYTYLALPLSVQWLNCRFIDALRVSWVPSPWLKSSVWTQFVPPPKQDERYSAPPPKTSDIGRGYLPVL